MSCLGVTSTVEGATLRVRPTMRKRAAQDTFLAFQSRGWHRISSAWARGRKPLRPSDVPYCSFVGIELDLNVSCPSLPMPSMGEPDFRPWQFAELSRHAANDTRQAPGVVSRAGDRRPFSRVVGGNRIPRLSQNLT